MKRLINITLELGAVIYMIFVPSMVVFFPFDNLKLDESQKKIFIIVLIFSAVLFFICLIFLWKRGFIPDTRKFAQENPKIWFLLIIVLPFIVGILKKRHDLNVFRSID